MKRLFISACEVSANVHLKEIVKFLPKDIAICGVFDKDIFRSFPNATPTYTSENFAIMGFFDVFKKARFFTKAIKEMSLLASSCDVALLMDSSSFHIPIAKNCHKLKAKGKRQVKILYYILPQVWAWKPWRRKIIESVCDYLCSILPFEEAFYHSPKLRYVGHPLLDEITHFKSNPLPFETGIIAFMPGSRKAEIARIFPLFRALSLKLPNVKRQILVLPEHFKALNADLIKSIYGDISGFEVSFNANDALLQASFAFVCSGTATLQATLIGTPIVLAYKARGIDVLLARIFVKLRYIGLANIFYNALHCGTPKAGGVEIHKEFIQGDLSVENLLQAYESIDIKAFFAKSLEIRQYLKHGSARHISAILGEILLEND